MATGGFKNPAPFGDNDLPYEQWRTEIEMWQLVTDMKAEKQALAVTLSLRGQAKAIALELEKERLNSEEGMGYLLQELDKVFKRNENDILYHKYREFEKFQRTTETMNSYIIEFERLYNILKSKQMALPEAVLAFKLLDKASLGERDKQLALTACNFINLENMKSALRRIFGDSIGQNQDVELGVDIKQEVFYSKEGYNYRRDGRYKNSFPRRYDDTNQKQGLRRNMWGTNQNQEMRGTNPIIDGKRSSCHVCGSLFHWKKYCPENNNERQLVQETHEQEDCQLVMFTRQAENHCSVFMAETFGTAILDTACTSTVCGSKWLFEYKETLKEEEKAQMEEKTSERMFRFGDGAKVQAVKNVVIPAKIGEKQCKISTDVVELDLPLLLSKSALKKANAVIDMKKDEATLFGQKMKLEQTSCGHYCVNLRNKGDYKIGDKVFFKRPSEDEWRGPARVIGQDGVVVFVRFGSQLMRVHVCRLKKVQETEKDENKQAIMKLTKQKTENKEEIQQKGSESEDKDFKQEEDSNSEDREKASPTCTSEWLRMALTIMALNLSWYFLAWHSQLKYRDVIAFCGYKFVGMTLSLLAGVAVGSYTSYYCVLLWFCISIVYFLVRTLRVQVLPQQDEASHTEISSGKVRPEILRSSLITDKQSQLDNLTTSKAATEKRKRVELAEIKEAKERKEVKDVIWVSTEKQLADVKTKKGVSPIRLMEALEKGRHM